MPMLTLQLLGGFKLSGAKGPPLPTRKAEALFAFLALSKGQPQARDKLAALLWSDRADPQARHSLAQTLYVIRRSLGESNRDALRTDPRRVTLDLSQVAVDVHDFGANLAIATRPALEHAVSVYRGELLDGLAIADEAFEEWLRDERRRLQALALEALQRLLQLQLEDNDDEAAIASARLLLDLDSLQEAVHRTLMQLYWEAGRVNAAVRQFQSCVEILQRELDVEAAPETQKLFERIISRRTATGKADSGIATLQTTAFHSITFNPAIPGPPLRWVQFPYASRDWAPRTDAGLHRLSVIPGGYWARTLETLSAFVLRKRAALTAANTDYARVVVTPPSETWPNCSTVPGRVKLPGAV